MKNRERINSVSIALVIVLTVIALASSNKTNNDTQYYRSATVIDKKNDVCYLEDTEGNLWTYEDENLKEYARYVLVMDNCNTDDIIDDVIVSIE